jgi:hypothetical protein
VDVKLAHDGARDRQIFLILGGHTRFDHRNVRLGCHSLR